MVRPCLCISVPTRQREQSFYRFTFVPKLMWETRALGLGQWRRRVSCSCSERRCWWQFLALGTTRPCGKWRQTLGNVRQEGELSTLSTTTNEQTIAMEQGKNNSACMEVWTRYGGSRQKEWRDRALNEWLSTKTQSWPLRNETGTSTHAPWDQETDTDKPERKGAKSWCLSYLAFPTQC